MLLSYDFYRSTCGLGRAHLVSSMQLGIRGSGSWGYVYRTRHLLRQVFETPRRLPEQRHGEISARHPRVYSYRALVPKGSRGCSWPAGLPPVSLQRAFQPHPPLHRHGAGGRNRGRAGGTGGPTRGRCRPQAAARPGRHPPRRDRGCADPTAVDAANAIVDRHPSPTYEIGEEPHARGFTPPPPCGCCALGRCLISVSPGLSARWRRVRAYRPGPSCRR